MTDKPDIARLEHLLAWATEEQAKAERGEPSEWAQEVLIVDWDKAGKSRPTTRCGTACCIAGKVALEDGAQLGWDKHGYSDDVLINGGPVRIDIYAERALGLTSKQADVLFDPDNTVRGLRLIIEAIKRGDSDEALSELHDELLRHIPEVIV